jgi:outer membrane protein assembly factor BamB
MGGRIGGLAALLIAIAIAGCGGVERADGPVAEWPAPNGDLANTRHVASAIDRRSVGRLRVAWKVPMPGFTATPVVVDGVVYAQDGQSDVSAIDLRTGDLRWRHRYGMFTFGPNGVAVGDGRVYGATPLFAFALDARTGRELWRRAIVRSAGEGIDMAPGFHDGTVFVSTAPSRPEVQYGPGAHGVLWALDAATGRPRWSWATVPKGLWGDPGVNSGGGLWHTPSFDGAGHLFASVANPGPVPGTDAQPWGASRPGPDRWTNSLVKLDERTGTIAWARQVLPHDIYDWDLECPAMLARIGGRDVAIVGGKMGIVYAFDADGGALLWKQPVGRHNGHDDDNLKAMHGGRGLRVGMRILPGQLGGIITQMAIAGTTVYAPVNELMSTVSSNAVLDLPDSRAGRSEMVALDAASGRPRWQRPLPGSEFGGATVTNGLVFTTTYEGTIWALDARDGRIAWRAQLPAGANAPVAVAGDTVLAGAGVQLEQEQRPALVAYRLAGGG